MGGAGCFLHHMQGEASVLLWSAAELLDRGVHMSEACTWVPEVHAKFQEKFFDACQFAPLPTGSTLWVPYGWMANLVVYESQEEDSEAHDLLVPYFNKGLLAHLSKPLYREVSSYMAHSAESVEMKDWVGSEESSTGPTPAAGSRSTLAPLEDGQVHAEATAVETPSEAHSDIKDID